MAAAWQAELAAVGWPAARLTNSVDAAVAAAGDSAPKPDIRAGTPPPAVRDARTMTASWPSARCSSAAT